MKLNGDFPTVLFSIEIGARELDSKLVMASALAAKGCRAIVGHKEAVKEIARASKNVVWQGKSLFSAKSRDYMADHLIANNSGIMFLHDEGAMHQVDSWTENVLKNHHVDDLRKRKINRICVWGERQKEVLSSYAAELGNVTTVTGSPRFDLCSPSYSWLTSLDKKKEIDSPYILACSRFVNAAHAEGQGNPFQRRMNPRIWPENFNLESIASVVFSQWQRAVHDFADFVVLIKEIAVHHPNRTMVLRPHPSENLTFYEQAFSSFKNVVVTREGSALDWIRSADLVVHSNCTTGIEAVLAGRPVLNLLPASDTRGGTDVEVAREAGVTAESIPEALDKTNELLSKNPGHVWSLHAQSILNNLKTESIPLLLQETAAVIRENNLASARVTVPSTDALEKIGAAARRIAKWGGVSSYTASKRGGALNAQHVESVVEGCRSMQVGAGRVSYLADQFVVMDP